jgi:hypothetical protein
MPQVGVHISDVIVWLKESRQLDVAVHRIRYAVHTLSIPRPYTTASGDFGWPEQDLPAIASYFRNPKKPGRPKGRGNNATA